MKYHFIYPDVGTGYLPDVHHGLAQLSAILKEAGNEVSLHHIKKLPKQEDILKVVDKEKPDIIGFTTMSNQAMYVKQWSKWIKQEYDIPIVCGGVHATLNPNDLLNEQSIDSVCVGEGDKAILSNAYWSKGLDYVVKSKPYPFSNLDDLPYPDYSIFDCDKILKAKNGNFAVIVSRGCPYQCSYCCNHALMIKQAGLGKYFRYRSVDNVINQLLELIGQYNIKSFSFADDIFGINMDWVAEFCRKYPNMVGLPFECNLRVEMVSEDILAMLKKANCVKVEMGIESGNEWMRKEILSRKMSNEKILTAFHTAHELGLKTRAYNMIGLPYETCDMIRETINLNKEAKPDQMAVFYFYPYYGTKLYDVCKEEGMLSNRETTSYVTESVLDLPTISKYELKKLYDEFYRLVIDTEIKAFPSIIKRLVGFAEKILRLIMPGKEVAVVRGVYMRLAPIIRRLI